MDDASKILKRQSDIRFGHKRPWNPAFARDFKKVAGSEVSCSYLLEALSTVCQARSPSRRRTPTEPLVSYGISKLAAEKYLHLYKVLHGLDYTILRVANPFGERQRINTAQGGVAVFAARALSQQDIEIWGDGSVTRDYVYIQDVADAFVKAIEYEGEPHIFNIGSGVGRSLNEILVALEDVLGRSVSRRYLPGRRFDVPVNVLDVSRARELLAWQPQVSFHEGLTRTLEWMRHW